MVVAVYARVSDMKKKEDGERRQDVGRQVHLINEYLDRAQIPAADRIYFIDDGKSAFTDDINQRPQFKKLLNEARAHRIKKVYLEDMTRFSRNLSQGLKWLEELGSLNVQVISLREGELEVTTANGWQRSALFLFMAEWDSRIKSEKVTSGMRRAKEKGVHTGRPPKKKGGSKNPTSIYKESQATQG